ncbi:MAG: protein kinase [Burkholderiales bacterium]|nr:protein kinase [Burkholderiales bacterium]
MDALDKQRWLALSPLLDELLDLDLPARAERLTRLQADNPEAAEHLRRLLERADGLEQQGFLSEPVVAQWHDALASVPDDAAPPPDLSGQTLGPYLLERQLGQGGMGTVWLARRADGRFEGQVAVKFLMAGLLGRGDAGRFAREGEILARLSHPHIARLLDAGMHGQQPYLVLEYVDGQPIDAYCRKHGLDIEARVRLFLDVLAAVAHAHARLILHRDLKPSNILVTAEGEVKLLDFGIAKLLDDASQASEGAAATELTQRAGSAFTPQFAAPEQVQQADVTTATDVYALGVLLYLLLGGSHPTADDTQTQLDRLKAVVEHVPRRLSDAAARQPDGAVARQARQLRGDLDTIVAKALKKAPAERYANAQAMADDLQRWLAHEPISARPDSRLYVLGRFVRRHRLAVAAGSMAVLALVGLTAVSALQARRAEAAEQQAQARRQQAEDLLSYMLGDFADKLRPIGRLELLDSVGAKSLSFLAEDPHAGPAERLQRAKALTVIGEVRVSRGDLDAALEPLRAARALLDGDPPELALTAPWRKAQGGAAFWLGQALLLKRDMPSALAALEDYRVASQRWLDALPQDMEAVLELSYAYTNLGSTALDAGRLTDAQAAFTRSIGLKRRALLTLDPARRDAPTAELANSLSFLGKALLWQGQFEAASRTFHEALAEIGPVRQKHAADALWIYREAMLSYWAGETLLAQGRAVQAHETLSAAAGMLAQATAQDPANKAWQIDRFVVDLADQEARTLAGRPGSGAELASLLGRLEQIEQAGGPAMQARRLPERARWARLHAGLRGMRVELGGQALRDTRQRLRAALQARPGDERLSRSLALLDEAWMTNTRSPTQARREVCDAVLADMREMRAFLRTDHVVTAAWLAAQSCPGHEADAEVTQTRDWLSSRR